MLPEFISFAYTPCAHPKLYFSAHYCFVTSSNSCDSQHLCVSKDYISQVCSLDHWDTHTGVLHCEHAGPLLFVYGLMKVVSKCVDIAVFYFPATPRNFRVETLLCITYLPPLLKDKRIKMWGVFFSHGKQKEQKELWNHRLLCVCVCMCV